MSFNLRDYKGPEKQDLINKSTDAFKQSGSDAYQLSMPLLLAATLDDDSLYIDSKNAILESMNLSEKKTIAENIKYLHDSSTKSQSLNFKSWLIGRIVVAANSKGDKSTADYYAKLLAEILNDQTQPDDAFKAWAWGYLNIYYATNDLNLYKQNKEKMRQATSVLIRKGDSYTNILWAEVMALQASAFAKDKDLYDTILNEMKSATKTTTLTQALSNIPVDDYRAWAMGSVYIAATFVEDEDTLNELAKPIKDAIQNASQQQDKLLAQTLMLLANFNLKYCSSNFADFSGRLFTVSQKEQKENVNISEAKKENVFSFEK